MASSWFPDHIGQAGVRVDITRYVSSVRQELRISEIPAEAVLVTAQSSTAAPLKLHFHRPTTVLHRRGHPNQTTLVVPRLHAYELPKLAGLLVVVAMPKTRTIAKPVSLKAEVW